MSMRFLLVFLSILIINSVHAREVYYTQLVIKNGITYKSNSDNPFNGKSISYHSNSRLKESITYVDGLKNGLYETFHDNGQLQIKSAHLNGVYHGPYEERFSNGDLKIKTTYQDGEEVGPCITTIYHTCK